MGWKQHGNRRYYFRVQRHNGRQVARCYGCGDVAEAQALVDQARIDARRAEAATVKDLRQELRDRARTAQAASKLVDVALGATLGRAGYYRHYRGSWRRRRGMGTQMTTKTPTAVAGRVGPPVDRLAALEAIQYARNGSAEALAAVEKYFRTDPELMLELTCSNLEEVVEDATIRRIAHQDPSRERGILTRLVRMRLELEGPNPTAVEKLLVGRVLATWLGLMEFELVAPDPSTATTLPARFTVWDRARSQAERRHLQAVKALATVRRLNAPGVALQVNIGTEASASNPPPALDAHAVQDG